jgi:hypothetical protein
MGFRISAYYRHDGGYISRGPASFQLNDHTLTGVGYGAAATVTPVGPIDHSSNSQDSKAIHAALKIAPADSLTLTPSFFFQRQNQADVDNTFWLSGSDPGTDRYFHPAFTAGAPAAGGFTPMSLPQGHNGYNETDLGALNITWEPAPSVP